MYCVKCNCEIADGAKFCTVCGEPVKRNRFCYKCGNELEENMKFCMICGTRVEALNTEAAPAKPAQTVDLVKPAETVELVKTAAAAAPVKPAETVDPVKPMGAAEPVKPVDFFDEPDFEVPVIAPVISEEPDMGVFTGVDAPTSSAVFEAGKQTASAYANPVIPKPAYSDTPKSGSASSINSGYIPPYDPSYNSSNSSKITAASTQSSVQTPTVVSNAPAAAVKKSGKKPAIIIAVVAVLVVALIAGVIVYFTNTAAVLSTVMGKSNYAAMIEGNSIRQATALLDASSVSGGIKTATGFYHTLGTLDPDGNGDLVLKLSDTSGSSDVQYVNLSSFFEALSSAVKDTYGVNSVVVSLGMNAELTDTGRTAIKNNFYIDDEGLDELLEYINGSKLSYGMTAGSSSAAFKAGVEVNGLKLDARLLINSKGEAYIVLPFASEKAILVKLGDAIEGEIEFSEADESVLLELDDKEIERFIGEVVELYIESYKNAEIEMENGEISVSGVSVSGKVLTAEFDSEMLEKLIADIGKKLAEDSYFKGKIVEYLKECGVDITESKYEEAILDATSDIRLDDSAKLKITTVINNSGTVLGKTYQLSSDSAKFRFSYAEADSEFAFELKSETSVQYDASEYSGSSESGKNTASVSVKLEKKSDTNGTATVKLVNGSTNVTFKIKYENAKIEKFCGKDIPVGKYEISVSLPKDFTEENATQANYSELLVDSKLVLSSSVSGSTYTASVGCDSDKLGSISLTYSITAENSDADLSVPSSVLDLSPYVDGDEPDDAVKQEIIEYLEAIRDAIKDQNAGEAGDAAAGALDEIISSANSVSYADVMALRDSISESAGEILDFSSKYDIHDNALYNEVLDLYEEYYDLYLDFTDIYYENYTLTNDEYADFQSRLEALDKEKKALENKYKAAAGIPADTDFSSLKADEIMSVLAEYKDKFNEIINGSMAQIEANDALKSIYDECTKNYTDAFNRALEAYREYIADGTVDKAVLDSAISALEDFVNAYESLNNELQ